MDDILKILGIENTFPFIFNQSNQDENIAFTTDLPNVDVTAYAADYQLGPDATYQQYYDWALEKRRKEAWQKAHYLILTPFIHTFTFYAMDCVKIRSPLRISTHTAKVTINCKISKLIIHISTH